MCRYVRPLTEKERQELASFVWSSPWRIARRGRAILLSGQGFTIAQLVTIFDVDERTVRNWLDAYEAEGCKGLEDAPHSGRPRCTAPDQDSLIAQVVEKGPAILGCLLSVKEFFCQMDEAQALRLASLLPEKLLRSYLEIGVWTKRHSSGAD